MSIDPPSDTNEKPLIKQEQYLVEVIKKPSSLAVESATSMESVVSTMSYQSAHKFKEETITESLVESTTIFDKISKQMTATELFETTTEHIMQTPKSPSFQIQANRTKLMLLNKTRQIFVPKSQRQRTTIKTKPTGYISKLHNTKPSKIISYPGLKIPPKPFAWLPKGWKIDQNAPSPMLIKFWSEMPLVQDGFLLTTSSSKDTTSYKKLKHQRINSRRPQKNVLKEVTSIELKKQFHKF